MKINIIGSARVVMDNPMSRHNYFGWPTVARLKNGRIAAAASGYRLAHICPFGKAVMAFSDDDGETYTRPFPVIDTPLDDRDAGLCPFGTSALIVTSFNNTAAFQRESGYGGEYRDSYLDTVTDEDEAKYLGSTFCVSFDNGITFGPLYKSPVTSPHGPTEMPDGSIIYVGNIFGDSRRIAAYTLDPHTGAMQRLGEIPQLTGEIKDFLLCEPHTISLPDGTLLCHIRVEGDLPGKEHEFGTYQSVSVDGGKTWSYPTCIADPMCGAPAHLMIHSTGTIICAAARRNEPWGIVAFLSNDGGKTWSDSQFIYRDYISADLGYPATVELEDGSLQTVFYVHPEKDAPAIIMSQKWEITK